MPAGLSVFEGTAGRVATDNLTNFRANPRLTFTTCLYAEPVAFK